MDRTTNLAEALDVAAGQTGGDETIVRGSACEIWSLVAPGEPCPTCDESYSERLDRARDRRG